MVLALPGEQQSRSEVQVGYIVDSGKKSGMVDEGSLEKRKIKDRGGQPDVGLLHLYA